ncbi:hypothetical protein O181_091306 [Austropuccinia psidii MF-1]|uniref:Uncharacterized protein n=1 Tax=Austropuccinia psidii MF-1 TaxID=1389203 RepID=A0A9Q3IX71_9BASI|nr:hypothetical protein [Austropuccinia psidii MF-1]
MLVMLADKHTRNIHSLSAPCDHVARGVPTQDALGRTPLCSTMMKPYPSVNGHWDPKQANRNDSRQLALSPQGLICPPPLLGHHPMVTSLLNRSEVIIWPMKDCNGERTFKLGPIVTMTYSPVPSLPRNQTLRQPTPGPSGTQWLKELFCEPSRTKEPPIPGPSPSCEPPEDILTREPEPEVAPTQSTEEPFGKSPLLFLHSYQPFLTFSSTISTLSCHSLLDNFFFPDSPTFPSCSPGSFPSAPKNPKASSPRCKAPLIPMMTLARNLPTYNQL